MEIKLSFATILMVTSLVLSGCNKNEVSFKDQVKPILEHNCVVCHQQGGSGFNQAGLDLTTYKNVMQGTKFGKVVIPGSSAESTLLRLVNHKADRVMNMPRGNTMLPEEQRLLVENWIEQGAKNN